MTDTILCHDKEDAKNVIDAVGSVHVNDWEFLEGGKVRIYLNCRLSDIKGQNNDN